MLGGAGVATVPLELAAEDLDAYLLVAPPAIRVERPDVVVIDSGAPSPLFRWAACIRFSDTEPDGSIEVVRSWFRERSLDSFTWKLGPHTTPVDLEARLRDHGAHEDEAEPEHTAMVLDHEPPASDGVEVRAVESLEDYTMSAEILAVGFGGSFTDEERAGLRAQVAARFATYRDHPIGRRYLAFVDGRPVATGSATRTTAGVLALGGGATLPEARGRGAYRALVRARWDEAVREGTPVLVTQASGMSQPILTGLGFRAVGRVIELIDSSNA